MTARAEGPLLARLILRLFVPSTKRETVLDDLEEEFRTQVEPRLGRSRAHAWYWKQAASLAVLYFLRDTGRGARSPLLRGKLHSRLERSRAPVMHNFIGDLKYAFRTMMRNKGFTLVAVLTLAIGIGSNSASFSIVNAVVLRPLPYADSEELVIVRAPNLERGIEPGWLSPPDYFDWRAESDSFDEMAFYWSPELDLTGGGEPARLRGAIVSWTLFPVLQVEPVLGRGFRKEKDSPGGERVVTISDGLWRRRWGGTPGSSDRR